MLSNRELVHIAEKDGRQKTQYMQDLVFGLMDCCVGMLLFVPFFGQSEGDIIRMVSLLSLNEPSFMIRAVYFAIILLTLVCGVATLALQNCSSIIWTKGKAAVSMLLSAIGVIIFMISLEPYAAFLCLYCCL